MRTHDWSPPQFQPLHSPCPLPSSQTRLIAPCTPPLLSGLHVFVFCCFVVVILYFVWHVLFHPFSPCLEKSNPSCKTWSVLIPSPRSLPPHQRQAPRLCYISQSLLTTASEAGKITIVLIWLIRKLNVENNWLAQDRKPREERSMMQNQIVFSKPVNLITPVSSFPVPSMQLKPLLNTRHSLPRVLASFSINQKALWWQELDVYFCILFIKGVSEMSFDGPIRAGEQKYWKTVKGNNSSLIKGLWKTQWGKEGILAKCY